MADRDEIAKYMGGATKERVKEKKEMGDKIAAAKAIVNSIADNLPQDGTKERYATFETSAGKLIVSRIQGGGVYYNFGNEPDGYRIEDMTVADAAKIIEISNYAFELSLKPEIT